MKYLKKPTKTPTNYLEKMKEYYWKNKAVILEKRKSKTSKPALAIRQREWNKLNPERYILNNARSRAKKRGILFELSEEDIQIPSQCPYLKVPLTFILGEGKQETNFSIDRIDPSKGYIKGNIQIISKKANTMKSNASREELLTFARSVLEIPA